MRLKWFLIGAATAVAVVVASFALDWEDDEADDDDL
jgi:hypothetical protein